MLINLGNSKRFLFINIAKTKESSLFAYNCINQTAKLIAIATKYLETKNLCTCISKHMLNFHMYLPLISEYKKDNLFLFWKVVSMKMMKLKCCWFSFIITQTFCNWQYTCYVILFKRILARWDNHLCHLNAQDIN